MTEATTANRTKPKKLASHGIWWERQWNPWIGCTPIGAACDHCWARREEDTRFRHLRRCRTFRRNESRGPSAPYFTRGPSYQGDAELLRPLHWKQPRIVGACMRSDLFHEDMRGSHLERAFSVMASCPQHTFIIPTKRTERAREFLRWLADTEPAEPDGPTWPFPNVWLLASVWDQPSADRLIPPLLECPAALRGVSYEPALAPVDLRLGDNMKPDEDSGVGCVPCEKGGMRHQHYVGEPCFRGIDWVIAGGESGQDARPAHPEWFTKVREDCSAAGVPFLFKQWGEWTPYATEAFKDASKPFSKRVLVDLDGQVAEARAGNINGDGATQAVMYRVGRARAGRKLYDETWSGWPEIGEK